MLRRCGRILSIVMIILMIIPFSLLVYAEDVPPDAEEAASVQTVQSDPELSDLDAEVYETADSDVPDSETPDSETPDTEVLESEPAPEIDGAQEPAVESLTAEPEALSENMPDDPEPAESAPEPALSVNAPEEPVLVRGTGTGAVKAINIGGTKLDGNSEGSGNGWIYEKDSGKIVLRDFNYGADITSDGTGVDIISTGFNSIGVLSCDGDINIIGAGILLIEQLEIAEDCSLNLLPLREYYGDDGGSVAVFLLQEDGSYMLINGSVKGIIDEQHVLPDDIKLVVPERSVIELQALDVIIETDADGNETIIRDLSGYSEQELKEAVHRYYGGILTVSNLTVDPGASIVNKVIEDSLVAAVQVTGSLVNNGTISGGRVTVYGDYSGSGTIEDAKISLIEAAANAINIKDSILSLEAGDYSFEQFGVSGRSELYYSGDLEISNIRSSSQGALEIYSMNYMGDLHRLKLTGTVDGAGVSVRSGTSELGAQLKLLNGGSVSNSGFGGPVFNYSGIGIAENGMNGSVFIGPDNITVPQPDSIPVVSFTLHDILEARYSVILSNALDTYFKIILRENMREGEVYTVLDDYSVPKYNAAGLITYSDLLDAYFPEGPELPADIDTVIFEVFSCRNGRLSMTLLGDDPYYYEDSTESDGVFLIRMAYHCPWKIFHGGSSITSTRASQTGAGNIGGNSTAIIRGKGITRISGEDSPPAPVVPADTDTADPGESENPDDPDDADAVDPVRPDPVTPSPVIPDDPDLAGRYQAQPVIIYTAAADTISIRVDVYQPGDGTEAEVPVYILSAVRNGAGVDEFSRPVEVVMDYELPERFDGRQLYAVFENTDDGSDGMVRAYRAEYDEVTGKISFETSQTGEFVITALDFEGDEFSPEFYDEIEKTEEVQELIRILKEEEQNAGI